jgi:hypothetical protein
MEGTDAHHTDRVSVGAPKQPERGQRRASRRNAIVHPSNLTTPEMLAFLWAGHKAKYYFWEMVVIVRRVFFVTLAVFSSYLSLKWKTTLLLISLLVFCRLHFECWPHLKNGLNMLEMMSLVILYMTTVSGLVLLSIDGVVVELLISLLVIAANAFFFVTATAFMLKFLHIGWLSKMSFFKKLQERFSRHSSWSKQSSSNLQSNGEPDGLGKLPAHIMGNSYERAMTTARREARGNNSIEHEGYGDYDLADAEIQGKRATVLNSDREGKSSYQFLQVQMETKPETLNKFAGYTERQQSGE